MPGAIDFDSLASQALAPAPAAPPPGSANYDDLAGQVIDMQAAVDRARAQKNLALAQGSNPDSEAKALAASKTLGIPQPAASANLQEATQSAQQAQNSQTLAAAPGLSAFIGSNPLAARLAQDDFDKLGTLDRMWTALKTGVSTAIDSNALGRMGNTKQAAGFFGAQTPDTDAAIQTVEGRVAATPKLAGALGTVQSFAGFIAGLVDNAVTGGSAGAAGGALVGGALGAPVGGVGAVPGAVTGAGAGAVIGFNADMASVAAGNAYLKMGQMRGADGQALSEAGRQFGAIFTGAATYALGTYGSAIESKLVGGSAEKLAQQAIEQAVQTPTFARAATSFLGGTAKGAAQGAAFMTSMEASNIVGEQIAKAMTAGNFGTDPQDIVNRLSDAAINGALTLGALHATMGGIGLYGDFRTAQRAQAQAAMFKNILDGSAESKTRERDLGTFQQFMQAQTDGTPVESLHIPATKIRELYQGAAVDPALLEAGKDPIFGFVPDMAKQLAEAESNGGDVVINTADFVAHLAGSPIAEKLLPDIRVGADAMSLNEAKAFQKEYESRVKQAVDDAAGAVKEPDSAQQIADDVRQRAVAAGRPAAEASRYGQIFASRYVARAERRGLGEDPATLYKAEGVQIGDAGASPEARANRTLNQAEHVDLDTVKSAWDDAGISHSMHEKNGVISLNKIVVPAGERGAGKGTAALRQLTKYADESGQRIELTPSTDFGATSKARLVKLYKSLGFAENKGRNKDFSTMAGMIREPKRGRELNQDALPEEHIGTTLMEAGKTEGLYRYPKSSAKDLETIAKDKAPKTKVERETVTQMDGSEKATGHYRVTLPSGKKATIQEKDGKVWVNASGVGEGNDGSLLYDIAANYAHSNGLKFTGDPDGLSDAGMRRRLENMLSSAVKYGTTEHMEPHERQLRGKAKLGLPPLKWEDGAHAENIRSMVRAQVATNEHAQPLGTSLEYDARADAFRDASGNAVGDAAGVFADLANLERGTAGPGAGGGTSLQRTALFRSLLSGADARRALLARLRGDAAGGGEGAGSLERSFYQAVGDDRRGSIRFDDAHAVINLFEKADSSTLIHEAGHAWLEELAADSGADDSPAQLRADMATVREWLGADKFPGAPIVRFRAIARKIEAQLPPVEDGMTRLWRGNRPGEEGSNPVYTNDLPGIALPFRESYGGKVSYVDVPTDKLPEWDNGAGAATFAEFTVPKDLLPNVKSLDAPEAYPEITDAQHEQFARAAEAYLMGGKAPSRALAQVFSRFKQWLTKIYRTVAALDTPINDDIRGVFDRLLATDAELAEATKSVGLEPNFADRKQAGMTQAEWGAYTRAIDKANQQAEATMLDKMMATVRRQRTAEYRAERAQVADQVAKTVDARPDVQALNLLRAGKMPDGSDIGERIRLNTNFVVEVYGKDGLEALPKGITSKDGFDPAYVSEMLGIDSPDEMIRGLQSLEAQQREIRQAEGERRGIREYLIDQETDARMAERKGELTDEASIKDEAVAALHGEGQAELLATELRYLRRSAANELVGRGEVRKAGDEKLDAAKQEIGDLKMTARWNDAEEALIQKGLRESVAVTRPILEAMRARVDELLAGKTTAEIGRYSTFLRDERKAAREVQEAILKKDWAAAAAAKQRQIISHILYTKARAAAAEVERGTRNFERAVSKPAFKNLDKEYNDQIQDLLGRFGFDSGRGEELQRTKKGTLQEFVERKSEDAGIELQVDPALYDFAGKPVGELTLAEFRALDEAVHSLQEMGRGEKLIEVDGVMRDFEEVRNEVVAAIRDLGERMKSDFYDPKDAGALAAAREELFSKLRGIDASLTKPEALFDQIDKGDPLGIMNRSVFRRLKEAQHREDRTQEVASKALKAAVDATGKGWQKRLRDAVPDDPNLKNQETGRPMKLTRQRMLSIALNWGNDGNRIKLADGYRWDPRAVKAFLDRNMTKADWDFVQSIWRIFDANKADLDALQKRVTGVGLDLVKADRFNTPHGEYEGGYYPIVYDAARDFTSEKHAENAKADTLFPSGYTRATTPKGSTISRVEGVKRPIQLSLDIAPWKIGQTLHDLAFREAIMDADRVLSDGAVKRAFDDVFGSEYRKTLRPWLKHVANARNIDDAAISWIDKAISTVRTNTVMVGIGFRLSTILKHDLTALANSIGEIGAKEMLTATRDLYRPGDDGSNSWQFIFEKSAEMKYRQNAYDKDIASQYDKLLADGRYTALQKSAQHYGHLAVSKLDMGTAGPVWLSSYRRALAGGRNDADAVYLADKAVRNAHGAQGITDTAAIQRAKGAYQLINMFYGFFNHVYNRQRLIAIEGAAGVKNARAGEYRAATKNFAGVLARSFWYIAVPGLIEAIVATQGPNENKDEGWGEWAAKAVLGSVPAGIPIMRDVAKAMLEGRDYEGSPIVNAVNSVIRGGVDVAHALHGDETSPNAAKHIATAVGLAAGLPTAAPFAAGKFLWDYGTGEADPQSISEWYRGITTGKTQR